jgi:hypothetical protein
VSEDLAEDDGDDWREVEESDLLRTEPVSWLEKDGECCVDANNPRERLDHKHLN